MLWRIQNRQSMTVIALTLDFIWLKYQHQQMSFY